MSPERRSVAGGSQDSDAVPMPPVIRTLTGPVRAFASSGARRAAGRTSVESVTDTSYAGGSYPCAARLVGGGSLTIAQPVPQPHFPMPGHPWGGGVPREHGRGLNRWHANTGLT